MARKDEGGRSGGAEGLSMIDPTVLGGVINDLATMESAINAETRGLKAEFAKVGVSTRAIDDLLHVSRWLHDELPMLRRRHAAAALLAAQGLGWKPGMGMLTTSEDPATTTRQAADLAVQNVLAGLNGKPPGRDAVKAALAAIQRIRATKGQLGSDDLLFLETFYRGLGKDVYRLPGYMTNDDNWIAPTRTSYRPGEIVPTALDPKTRADLAAAAVGGLLVLSDERRGGGWNRLPTFVQKAAADPFTVKIMPDRSWVQSLGRDGDELAAFLKNAGPTDRGGVVLSKRLAITAAQSVEAYGQLSRIPPPLPYGDDETARTFLEIAGRNESAMRDLLTGKGMEVPQGVSAKIFDGYTTPKDFLVPITTNNWSDNGKSAATVIDWIADAKRSADVGRRQLADEAMEGLIATLTDPGVFSTEMDIGKRDVWGMSATLGVHPSLGVVNPEITRSLARDASAYLERLADPDSTKMAASARLFTLIATDPTSAEALTGAVYRFQVNGILDMLANKTDISNAAPAGRLNGLLAAAVQNVAIERGADFERAKAEAAALRSKVLGLIADIGVQGINAGRDGTREPELAKPFPGIDPVDLVDKLLGRFVETDGGSTVPQVLQSEGIDISTPTGSRLIPRYNLTKALVESGRLKIEDLPPDIRTGKPPRLMSPAEFRSAQFDQISESYHHSNATVPGISDLQGTYMDEYTAQTSGTAAAYGAADAKELEKKLRMG